MTKSFEYADREIGSKEVSYAVSNVVIGLGILTLPASIVVATNSSDGWVSILLGGLIAIGFAWMLTRLAVRFPKQSYRDIAASLTNRPTANVLTLSFAFYTFLYVSYEVRGVSSISKLYLFDRTPVEAICFVFLLVLVYGVSGPSISLLRLNLLFFPIILLILTAVLALSAGDFDYERLKPFFVTPFPKLLIAAKETAFSFLGFEILLFYNLFVNRPKKLGKAVFIGMLMPTLVYLLVFLFVVGVFSTEVVANTLFPLAELAKQVEVPGGFFERFESVFFAVWVMSLYCTAVMAFDVTLIALQSVFPKASRMSLIFLLTPFVFLVAMQPTNLQEVRLFSEWISYLGIIVAWVFPAFLLIAAKARRVKPDA
ncbi:GerAB/ArcD/ProY family transporter [Cohnella massiliensis]|uniref:GerAB/ArcD/ProY family transporter n=1 Tax=Cohnella massiliensis TaxID=1816691 RepID=UPI0011183DE0|nr:endospore germination permease [Cohnella massiliensis]